MNPHLLEDLRQLIEVKYVLCIMRDYINMWHRSYLLKMEQIQRKISEKRSLSTRKANGHTLLKIYINNWK